MTKIVIKDDGVTLESPDEALFYGLLRLLKVPVERTTHLWPEGRSDGKYQWCPDFYLTGKDLWVEVKGSEDDDDRARCVAWRAAGHRLAVLHREQLDVLRVIAQDSQAVGYLEDLADKAVR